MADHRSHGPSRAKEGYGQRRLECPHYEGCLDIACGEEWPGFTCEGCSQLNVEPDKIFDVHSLLARSGPSLIPAVPVHVDANNPSPVRRRLVVQSFEGDGLQAITIRVCPVCGTKARARGLCQRHYQRWYAAQKKGETTEEPIQWAIKHFGQTLRTTVWECCSVEGCHYPAEVRGLCAHHYHQQYRRERASARMEDSGCSTAT